MMTPAQQRRHRRSSPVPPTRAARSGAGPRGMVDPWGALEDEEEEEDEGGEDWEDMPERDSGRFDMVMNMIPGEHSKQPLKSSHKYCSIRKRKRRISRLTEL